MAAKKKAAKKPASKKAPKNARQKSADEDSVPLRDRIDAAIAGFGGTPLFAGLGVVAAATLFFGVGLLESRAAELLDRPAGDVRIAWPALAGVETPRGEQAPTWLPQSVVVAMQEAAESAASEHPGAFSREQLAAVGNSLHASGWFTSPPTVRRTSGGSLEIDGDWRMYAAVVRHGNSDYLVGRDGARLPLEYDPGASGLPVILNVPGVFAPPTVRSGAATLADYRTAWPGAEVPGALALLAVLSAEPFADQIAAVDTAYPAAMGGLTLVTTQGTHVVWGGAPGERKPGEASDEEKLARIRALHADYGSIDAGQPALSIKGVLPVTIDRSQPEAAG